MANFFFSANDGIHGPELWVTDGTANGTMMVKDINVSTSGWSIAEGFTNFDSELYFVADDGNHGHELWVTDGTADGTFMVDDINSTSSHSAIASQGLLHPIDDKLFFVADDGIHGYEIWAYG